MFNQKQFSEDVFMFRTVNNITRKQLAIECKVHPSSIQGLENKEYDPRTGTFLKICKYMNINPFNYLK